MKRISLLVCFLLGIALQAMAQPAAPGVTSNSPVCAGATLTITATSTGVTAPTYSLTGPFAGSPATNTSGVFNIPAVTVAGNSGTYAVTVTDGTQTSTAASITVTVNAVPAAPSISVITAPLCRDSTLVLGVTSPVAGATYRWTGPGGFTSNVTPAQRTGFRPSFNGTYSVYATVNGCESPAGTTNVTMTPPSAPPVRNNITYCQFDVAVALTATTLPQHSVTWYDTGVAFPGGVNVRPGPPTPNTAVPKITMWLVRQTAVGGCPSEPDSVYARVLPKPLPPAAASNTILYCQFEPVGPLAVAGTNIRWFTTPTGGTGAATAPTPPTLVPGTFNYYASQTTGDGCESDRVQLTVIVRPKPQPPVVSSPLNLCQGEPAQPLTALGQNLLWYALPNGGVGVPVAPVISTSYEDSFFNYVTQTVNGCESDRALISTYIRYKPNGIITASSQTLCQDGEDTFFYYGNGRPDAEYVWFAPLSSQFISGQSTPGPVVIRFDTAGTSVVQLIVNNKGCISTLIAAPITVLPLPEISFVNRQDACEDELINVALREIEPNINSYNWDFGPEATIVFGEITTGGPFGIRYPRAGHYTVTATATREACVSRPIVQDIYIHPRPDASISYAYRNGLPLDQFCAADTLHLTVQAVPEGATYQWTPAAYFQSREDSLNNEVRAVISMSSYVNVKVTSAFGCEATDSLYVPTHPCCGVYFPNAFVPASKTEVNSIFRPITIGSHRINNFRIINRWGQVMWESRQERIGWDGTYQGVPQDMGTYYYYINYRCENRNVEDKGEFILIR